jgi:hypothetical protein
MAESMTRVLVGNSSDEELTGAHGRKTAAWWANRLLWFAQDGDVIVLPAAPDPVFLQYVTGLTGVDAQSLRVVVPPPGYEGSNRLTADRLADPALHATLVQAVAGRAIRRVVPLWPDVAAARLAHALGAEAALPGYTFLAQGGGALVNSKAVFRAVAAAAGVPIPVGAVCAGPASAEVAIADLLAGGQPVIVKQEYLSGGDGNEILSPVEGITPIGAPWVIVLSGQSAVRSYVAQRWDWLTRDGQQRVVVERYHPDSTAVFAEFELTDAGIRFAGHGEMISVPVANSQIIPAVGVKPDPLADIVDGGRRLCGPLHAMGYRGMVSADAIVTPAGEVFFSEYNSRITGSAHVYAIVGERIVGPDYADARVIRERLGWRIPSAQAAIAALAARGLSYDRSSRTGVVLLTPREPSNGTAQYCIVAEHLAAATEMETELRRLFPADEDA